MVCEGWDTAFLMPLICRSTWESANPCGNVCGPCRAAAFAASAIVTAVMVTMKNHPHHLKIHTLTL